MLSLWFKGINYNCINHHSFKELETFANLEFKFLGIGFPGGNFVANGSTCFPFFQNL